MAWDGCLRRRVRCVFSESLNRQTLDGLTGPVPGAPPGGAWKQDAAMRWMRVPARVAGVVLRDVVTTMFPGDCRICGGPLLRLGSIPVCAACVQGLRRETRPVCRVCGEWMGMEGARAGMQFGREGLRCTPCRMVEPAFVQAVAYGVYEGGMREMLHLLKYEGMRQMAPVLGGLLAEAVEELEMPAGEVVLVAVPLYGSRRRERGYNQAELLAAAAKKALRERRPEWEVREAHGALARVKETESQFGLTPHGRRANLRGAFEVIDPAAVVGREVLLVDDIYTTGATARACAAALVRGGARRVWVATLARAQSESVAMWDMAAESVAWRAGGGAAGKAAGLGLDGSGPASGLG